ncbi:hypothetical protein [Microbacterium oxydans]|uniref:hypothetical protein n=1 Tax=Microbacterium oxydans TaxID=82380 RepID=UPI0037C76D5F
MTNHRRRRAAAATQEQKAISLAASRARAVLSNEDALVRDAVIAGGLLRLSITEVFG